MKHLLALLLFIFVPFSLLSQTRAERKLRGELSEYFTNYQLPGYGHFGEFKLDKVKINTRRRVISVYPNDPFFSQPFTPERIEKIYEEVKKELPAAYKRYAIRIFAKDNKRIESLIPNQLRKEHADEHRLWGDLDYKGLPWVTSMSRPYQLEGGLAGRHLMVNASHGRYYKLGKWRWQRPYLFCTTEDLLTHSFVYPYLIPMLENAGAVVLTSRERDPQPNEVVVDNERPIRISKFQPENKNREVINYRSSEGLYQEVVESSRPWKTAEKRGFALPAERGDTTVSMMTDSIHPFELGTARFASTTNGKKNLSQAVWTPIIPQKGSYAVYVSYVTLPNSIDDARYSVYHLGGRTDFRVNQKMGGNTWVYLGTFDFDAGENFTGRVVLSNQSEHKGVVTADAVRFGGGMGQTARDTVGTSGLPRFFEGARYQAQWCGIPDTMYVNGDGTNDYGDDIRSRSAMLNHVAGGSCFMPTDKGLKVPIELCVGIHSDAGIRADSSIYGSMAICTTEKKDGTRTYPAGISRKASFDLAARLLADVQADLSQTYGVQWMHRELWDRNYGETRLPDIPSVIFETLSHQNYTDLKFAHDPNFKFTLGRAIYKSMLRHIQYLHKQEAVVVQPLAPVNFAALLSEDGKHVSLSWEPVTDELEPTAVPSNYVVYTRENGEGFDNGVLTNGQTHLVLPIKSNCLYDFQVSAINAGGESFRSETLSVFSAASATSRVLIVNGFERLSGPARIEKIDSIGFDITTDLGVPHHYTASFAGAQLCFDASKAGKEGEGALGYCGNELEGTFIGGNTFNYPAIHGKAIATSGQYSYSSISKGAWKKGVADLTKYPIIDYIAGAEKDAAYNLKPYKTFDKETRDMLTGYLNLGGRLLVTGSYIGSDMKTNEERRFIRSVLKYDYAGTSANDSTQHLIGLGLTIPFWRGLHAECYPLQSPDAILPASSEAFTAFVYGGGKSAGIAYAGSTYRILAMGFPFESISDENIRSQAMEAILRFLIE